MQLIDYIPELIKALHDQLEDDQERWGDTWKERSVKGQVERTYARFNDYLDQYEQAGTPIPWMKIIGGAMICWVRETFEDWKEESDRHGT